MQLHIAELLVCQLQLCGSSAESNTLPDLPWTQRRLELLGSGLVTAKALLGYYLFLPLTSDVVFNNSEWLQLAFAITFSSQLAAIAAQPSMSPEVQQLAHLLGMEQILQSIHSRMDSLMTDAVDETGERDVFCHHQQRVLRIKLWFEGQGRQPAGQLAGPMAVQPIPLFEQAMAGGEQGLNQPPPRPPQQHQQQQQHADPQYPPWPLDCQDEAVMADARVFDMEWMEESTADWADEVNEQWRQQQQQQQHQQQHHHHHQQQHRHQRQ